MKYLLKTSNIPKYRQKINPLIPDACDVQAFERLAEVRSNIVDFTKNGEKLYIYSETCGNGKTTWAIKLMLQYFNEMWAGNGFIKRGIFLNVPTFLSKCKSIISKPDAEFEDLQHSLASVDLVIWDDIAATKLSDYDYNLLLTYIDQRVVNGKANIYTGNILPDKLANYVSTRLASRICGDSAIKIELKGGDRR
jgi:DNA replication protein DnaC